MTTLAEAVAALAPETARAWAEALQESERASIAATEARSVMHDGSVKRAGESVPQWLVRTRAEQAAWHEAFRAAQAAWLRMPLEVRAMCNYARAAEVLAALRARAEVTA